MKLDATTKSLEIILAGAITTTALPFAISYVDINQSTGEVTAMSEGDGTSNNTTAVTVAAAPAATTTRQIDFMSVYNADTVAATVTVRINNNGTFRILCKVVLQPGDTLFYGE